ncbi:MAG: class I SAM-dependent methyltransferase [Thermoanaerobaculaceae bacterium]|nr:class I SAM-dependent methyltransferase [Thermoanaerobaculaceae bacterium]TAM44611.1 MAG: class I SAM-dependent methyltransferase [Acidobacteriota bacterium]
MPRLPMTIPGNLEALAPEIPAGVLDEPFRAACERLDRYIGALVREMASALDLGASEEPGYDRIVAERGWNDGGSLAVRWLIETLDLYGLTERTSGGWRLVPGPAAASSTEIRAEAERLLPAAGPAYEVLELCAAALPAVLRGELRGQDALFGPTTLGLWFDYFSNSNPHYALNNVITGAAVARAARPGARILEVGGGGGSAAEAALAALTQAGRPPSAYVFTELQPAFLRRGARTVQRALPAGCECRALRFDINLEPAAQGLDGARFDVVFGVNTLHLAHDLAATLANLRALLAPGGAIVVGELLRPSPIAPVHLELPFTLLDEYGRVPLSDGIRERPGFMSAQGWTRALAAAGFREVTVIPAQIERCAAIYPGFYCGAVAARG